MSSNVTTPHGGTVGAGRLDARAMRRYLAPFKAAEPFRDAVETIDRCSFATQRNTKGDLIALSPAWNTPDQQQAAIKHAVAIRKAVAGHLDAVSSVVDALDEAMVPPTEGVIRVILGVLLSVLRSKPTEGAELYIDALVWELMEPDTGEPFCAPAIAAAAKEIWTTKTFAPSVAEFVGPVRKYQMRIETVRAELAFISEANYRAREVLEKLAPETLPKLHELTKGEEDSFWDFEDDVVTDGGPLANL
jgi:hypothetical protein